MVSSRKRGRDLMEEPAEPVMPPKEPSLLERIRNMWQFANLSQWIFQFGGAVKIDENLDISDLEMECLKQHSTVLPEIGLALLKFVSSHRGLTPEIFDEYTRRQYVAKAPQRNPFGIEEEPNKFAEFDIFTKIRVLQQLTVWTLGNPDRIREKMEEQKDTDQAKWRIEPFGWDADERTYYVLDDNRLYRQTDPPPPPAPAKVKKNSKKGKAARRASKRRKVSDPAESDVEPADEPEAEDEASTPAELEDDGFGGMKWECLAVTYHEYQSFVSSIEKTRDPNERELCKRIKEHVLPLLEKAEEARKRKAAQRERELLNLEKLATAKRSSRIAGRMEHQKAEEEAREAERKKLADLAMAKKEQDKWMKLEQERESRMMTREQRLKEREARRILHEDELANLSEDSKGIATGASAGRLSERHLKAEIEKKKQALEELAEEDDDWIFDCICGVYGQVDDGTHSIACDECNIWQHSKCVKVSQAEAERDDFKFVCSDCRRRAEDKERAKNQPPIKITIKRPGSSASPNVPFKANGTQAPVIPPVIGNANNVSNLPQKAQHSPSKASSSSHPPGSSAAGLPPIGNFNTSPLPRSSQQTSSKVLQSPYAHGAPSPSLPPVVSNTSPATQNQSPTKSSSVWQSPYAPQAKEQYPLSNGAGSSPNGRMAESQPKLLFTANNNGAARPSGSNVFSSPRLESPTNLPPPSQPYSLDNGMAASTVQNPTTLPPPIAPYGYDQSLSSPPAAFPRPPHSASQPISRQSPFAHGPETTPLPRPLNGSQYTNDLRRNSMTFSSPTPVLTPVYKPVQPPHLPSSPPSHPAPNTHPMSAISSSTSPQMAPNSVLPHVETGYSPTKHSPPRLTASNGSFGAATPHIIPPVASLSPSPSFQDLSPPVKPSEPERPRDYGQSVHH